MLKKRFLAAVLALCLLCACSAKQGEIVVSEVGGTLAHAADALFLAGAGGVMADCPAARENANDLVMLTEESMKEAVRLIKEAAVQPAVISEVPGAAGELVLAAGANSVRVYQLPPTHPKYPDKTLLWAEASGKSASYVADGTVYTALLALLDGAVQTQLPSMTGVYTAVPLMRGRDIPAGFAVKGNILVAGYTSFDGAGVIDFIDMREGRVVKSLDAGERILRLDMGTNGRVRYFTQSAVQYIDMEKQVHAARYTPPAELRISLGDSFDVDEKAGLITFIRGDALYVAKLQDGAEERKLFTIKAVEQSLTSATRTALAGAKSSLHFVRPRFTGGFAAVTTACDWQGMPCVAVSAMHVKAEDAAPLHYGDVFGTLGGIADYEGGVAMIRDENRLLFVDFAANMQWQVPIVPRERALQLSGGMVCEDVWEQTDKGSLEHNIYACRREGMVDKALLLTTVGLNVELQGTADGHVLVRNQNSDTLIVLSVPMV